MSGYLEKQGGSNNNKGWRKRLVSLENNCIRYFRNENVLFFSFSIFCFSISTKRRIIKNKNKNKK